MLACLVPALKHKSLILASGSPRRKELLCLLDVSFSVVPSEFPENLSKAEYVGRPEAYVKDNSCFKALDVIQKRNIADEIVIGCDTIVELEGSIIEKPKDSKEAVGILERLSGNTHSVYSGLTLAQLHKGSPRILSSYEKTDVKFAQLSTEVIEAYVSTKEPFGKAGAYGIQGAGALLVEGIVGDYYNVVGLPLFLLSTQLREFLGEAA